MSVQVLAIRGEGGPPEDPHSSEDDGEEAAKSFNHQLTHFPKSKHCEICMRAKMTAIGIIGRDLTLILKRNHHSILGTNFVLTISLSEVMFQRVLRESKLVSFVMMSTVGFIKHSLKHQERCLFAEIRRVKGPWSCIAPGRFRFSPRAYRSREAAGMVTGTRVAK